MYKEALRPVWAEINLTNLDYNIKQIKADFFNLFILFMYSTSLLCSFYSILLVSATSIANALPDCAKALAAVMAPSWPIFKSPAASGSTKA